jgi:hypothetical protein
MLSVATLGTVRGWTASDFGIILGDFRQAESPLGRGGAFQTHMHPDLVDYCITEIPLDSWGGRPLVVPPAVGFKSRLEGMASAHPGDPIGYSRTGSGEM